MTPTRRAVLRGAGAGLVAGVGCAPKKEEQAPHVAGSIDHIIVVMMENRSFDHMFGALALEEGRTDVDGLTADMQNPDADGAAVKVAPATLDCVPDPGHSWNSSHEQWNEGNNDGFVINYGDPEVMGYLNRDHLPVYYALADAYLLCDRWFCSVMGPTWPNRFYGHAGTSNGQKNNDLPDDGMFTFPTVWTHLDEIGVEWRYYYTDLPFIALFEDHFRDGTYGLLEDFFWDLENDNLPPVTWVDPGFSWCDDHPPHFVGYGQEWIAALYNALAASPYWDKCLLLITYDEHGGFFDHVPPPTTDDDFAADGFDQLGFRVPAIVIGPYVKKGVSTVQFDHASWIKLVCETYNIVPWNKRIAAATSLGEAIDWDKVEANTPDAPVEIPIPEFDTASFGEECSGQGVLGPPPPSAPPQPDKPLPKSLEPWHNLMRYLHREADQTHRQDEIHRFLRGRLVAERARRSKG